MKNIGVIGFGRFGQFLTRHLNRDFPVIVSEINPGVRHADFTDLVFKSLAEVCQRSDCLFLCVPINRFESLVDEIAPHVRRGMTILDVCSVKEHPAKVMREKLLLTGVDVIATHPMFGPDSGSNGLGGLKLVMSPVSVPGDAYRFWQQYFADLGLQVIEMSPVDHDRRAAYTQGITHYVGRVLKRLELSPTSIDTKSYGMLLSIIDQTCNDTLELFRDLHTYNRFTSEMRTKFVQALRAVDSHIRGSQQTRKAMTIGIPGTRGLLNETVCGRLCKAHHVENYEILCLKDTVSVLIGLQNGEIDRGLFALSSGRENYAKETLEALMAYPCEILDTIDTVPRNCLATRSDIDLAQVDTIVLHPQLLAHAAALGERYKYLKVVRTDTQDFEDLAGRNFSRDLIDEDTCARYLSEGKLPHSLAVVVPCATAEIFELRMHESAIPDTGNDNQSTFVWAARREYR